MLSLMKYVDPRMGVLMGFADKFGAATDKAVGAAKDKIGAAINRPALQAEGQAQNAVGQAKQADHDVEGTARDIVDDE